MGSNNAGLRAYGGATRPLISHCSFSGNATGLQVEGNARPILDNCCIANSSQYGLYAAAYTDGQGKAPTQNCSSGSATGPRTEAMGSGDRVTMNVSYTPWADFEICETSVTGVGDLPESVRNYKLTAPHPNPFNPTTTFGIAIPQTEHVRLLVFDLCGRLVRILVDEIRPAGIYELQWNGMDDSGQRVASGIYVCRMKAGSYRETRQMTLVK